MTAFHYDTSQNWYKGNTHLHSVASDGGLTFPEIEKLFMQTGHDFLFRTDHRVASDCAADDFDSTILWMDGIELDGNDETGAYYHVVCLGDVEAQPKEMSLNEAMTRNRERGAMMILAHPFWSGNTLEDAVRWDFDGVEIYNNICQFLNGKGSGLVHWEAMLKKSPSVLGLSVDDAHLKPDCPPWNGGWIMVNAAERTADAILPAIRAGNFYSSRGPEIYSMDYDGTTFTATFSPSRFVRLVGSGPASIRAPYLDEGESMSEVSFEISSDKWPFAYLEITDNNGLQAWTNNLFMQR